MSHILLTYHVEILDLPTVTNYIRQNLTANFSASHSCTLELPSGILSPYNLLMLLNYVVLRALWKIDVHLINTLVNKSFLLLIRAI